MAKVFIEETTLTAIGDAIRGKEGTTELVPVTDMATRITDLPSGGGGGNEPTDEELTLTGGCTYRFAYNGWDWFIEKYGNRITTKDIIGCSNMFNTTQREEVPFDINVNNCPIFYSMFAYANNITKIPNIRGTIKWTLGSTSFESMFASNYSVRSLENVFTPEMLNEYSEAKITSAYSCYKPCNFQGMYSLRQVPSWWYKFKINPESTAFSSSSYTIYYNMLNGCNVLDEITNIPVWKCQAAQTSNMFSGTFNNCFRVKNITFETNPDGTPIEAQWKSQTINLTQGVGHHWYGYNLADLTYRNQYLTSSPILKYNSGITEDKLVYDDATYQALKNDSDWWSAALGTGTSPSNIKDGAPYSRYNHDSAVATINSLPDTSAYLTTAGGTNTINFYGTAGSNTDGGAINTLTEAEIAVATAKGWTVTLS